MRSTCRRSIAFFTRCSSTTSSASNAQDFWASEAKDWSKEVDNFAGPSKTIREAVAGLIAPGDSEVGEGTEDLQGRGGFGQHGLHAQEGRVGAEAAEPERSQARRGYVEAEEWQQRRYRSVVLVDGARGRADRFCNQGGRTQSRHFRPQLYECESTRRHRRSGWNQRSRRSGRSGREDGSVQDSQLETLGGGRSAPKRSGSGIRYHASSAIRAQHNFALSRYLRRCPWRSDGDHPGRHVGAVRSVLAAGRVAIR